MEFDVILRKESFLKSFCSIIIILIFLGRYCNVHIDNIFIIFLLAPSEAYLLIKVIQKKFSNKTGSFLTASITPAFYLICVEIPQLFINKVNTPYWRIDPKTIFPFNIWEVAIHAWSWGIGGFFLMIPLNFFFIAKCFKTKGTGYKILSIFMLTFNILIQVLSAVPAGWFLD